MKRMKKECVICGTENPFYGWSGYAFFADQSQMTTGWCTKHEVEFDSYANPAFENREALELFKQLHPRLYAKNVKDKPVLFLDRFQRERESKHKRLSQRKPLYSKEELAAAEKELAEDFQRVKKEQEAQQNVSD